MSQINILLAEDDKNLGMILKAYLDAKGYPATLCSNGEIAFDAFKIGQYDFCIFDIMMPIMDGFTLAKKVKEINPRIPIIFLTAKTMQEDILEGFEIGADDYITKPFEIKELKARVRVALNNSAKKRNTTLLTAGDIKMDTESMLVTVCDKPVRFTRTEYAILRILISGKGRVISKLQLLDLIESDTPDCIDEASLKVHISNIRKKIRNSGGNDIIEAVWGIGFKVNSD